MGALFGFVNRSEEYMEYARQQNLLPSPDFQFGRLPTYGELKEILGGLPEYKVEYAEHDIYLFLKGQEVAALRVPLDKPRNDSCTVDFYWKYSSEGIMPLIQAIANVCGTIVIYNDSSPDLVFVYPNIASENNPAT